MPKISSHNFSLVAVVEHLEECSAVECVIQAQRKRALFTMSIRSHWKISTAERFQNSLSRSRLSAPPVMDVVEKREP